MEQVRILTWNLERKKPTTPTGREGIDYLHGQSPDAMVLTESRLSFPAADGHLVSSETWGDEDERKVVMWSRACLRRMYLLAMANVRYGNRNRRPWEDHISYCEALSVLIASSNPSIPLVVAGDLNQRIPGTSPNVVGGVRCSDHGGREPT